MFDEVIQVDVFLDTWFVECAFCILSSFAFIPRPVHFLFLAYNFGVLFFRINQSHRSRYYSAVQENMTMLQHKLQQQKLPIQKTR